MNLATFTLGKDKKSMTINWAFDAPIEKVWAAFTTQELLEQWWAPKPWKAVTKEFDFRDGGHWLYAMTSPEGKKHWSKEDYQGVKVHQSFEANDYFCDQEGRVDPQMPTNHWLVEFTNQDDQTLVTVTMACRSTADLQKLIDMGFKEGFTMGLNQLDELLSRPDTN